MEDYLKGNKGKSPGAFGGSASNTGGVFGGTAASPFSSQPAAGSFGSSGMSLGSNLGGSTPFGTSSALTFGAPSTNTGAFGASGFGATQNTGGGGIFGGGAQQPSTAFGGGLALGGGNTAAPFGAKPAAPAFGATGTSSAFNFGGASTTTAPTFGAFGAPAPAPAAGGLFGAPAPAPGPFGTPSGGGFNFGSSPQAPSAVVPSFGAPAPAPGAVTFGGGGGGFNFGAAQPPAPAFGAPAPAPTAGLFGGASGGAGLFGSAPAPAPSMGFGFGTSAPAPAPAAGGFGGGFGGFNLGGGTAGTGAFGLGAAAKPPAAAPATNMFGSTGMGGGTGGLGMFGATSAPATQTTSPSAFGFGFGTTASALPTSFGSATPVATAQPHLVASHSQQAYGGTGVSSFGAGLLMQKVGSVQRSSQQLELRLGGETQALATTRSTPESDIDPQRGAGSLALAQYGHAPRSAARIRPRGSVDASASFGAGLGSGSLSESAQSNGLHALPQGSAGVMNPNAFLSRSSKRLVISSHAPKAAEAGVSVLPTAAVSEPTVAPTQAQPIAVCASASDNNGPSAPSGELNSSARWQPLQPNGNGAAAPAATEQSFPNFMESPRQNESDDGSSPSNGVVIEPFGRRRSEQASASDSPLQSFAPYLDRPDYYCSPSIADLQEMSPRDLTKVRNFEIWRPGFGSIRWRQPVDLSSANLDEIVSIGKKTVSVYDDLPDSKIKPLVGQGLNQPATITMEQVWPKNGPCKGDREAAKYQEKLVQRAADMGAEFVAYDGLAGTWAINVPHFSKYTLDDESDDDDMGTAAAAQQGGPPGSVGAGHRHPYPSGQKSQADDLALRYRAAMDAEEARLKRGQEVKPDRRDFGTSPEMDEEELASSGMVMDDDSALESGGRRISWLGDPAGQAVDMDTGNDEFRFAPPAVGARSDLGTTTAGPQFSFAEQSRVRLPASIAGAHSERRSMTLRLLENVMERRSVARDLGLRKGRTFGVSWGPNGELVQCRGDGFVSVRIDRMGQGGARNGDDSARELESALHVNQKSSICKQSPSQDLPALSATPPIWRLPQRSSSGEYEALVQCVVKYSLATSDSLILCDCWSLLNSLWGQEVGPDGVSSLDLPLPPLPTESGEDADGLAPWDRRRAAISQWFERAVERRQSQRGLPRSSNKQHEIVECLLSRKYSLGAQKALSTSLPRLAILLSLGSASDPFVREQLAAQLEVWTGAGVLKNMSGSVLRSMELLSGGACHHGSLGACGGTWLEQVAECLWHSGGGGQEDLHSALSSFLQAVKDGRGQEPFAGYLGNHNSTWDGGEVRREWCLLFHLLELYATDGSSSAIRCLDPACRTLDLLDYSHSWHLMSVLQALHLPYPSPDATVRASISSSFACQLCWHGLWPWAVYVLLHEASRGPTSEQFMTSSAREIVMQHGYNVAQDQTSSMWKLLVETIQVPKVWLHEAAAVKARYEGRSGDAFHHLTAAGLFDDAAEILMQSLAPKWLLNGSSHQHLMQLLGVLETHKSRIRTWATHCEPLLTLLRVEEGTEVRDLGTVKASLMQCLERLCPAERVGSFRASDPQQRDVARAALEVMDVSALNYLMKLCSEEDGDLLSALEIIRQSGSPLEYRTRHLLRCTSQFIVTAGAAAQAEALASTGEMWE
jgi:hypothetical protein